MSGSAALEPAWVLHARPYRETSQIIELLTRDHGRVGAVLRGARGRRRGGAPVRQFLPMLVRWSGRGSLKSLTAMEPDGATYTLTGETLLAGLYLNEVLLRVLKPFDAHEALYDLYGATLERLLHPDAVAGALRSFERRLLEEIGYGISFTQCAGDGEPIRAQVEYVLAGGEGFVPHARVASERTTFPGAALLSIGRDDYEEPATRRLAQQLFRRLLEPHLGGYPIQSSRLLAEMRRGTAGGGSGHPVGSP